MRGMANCLFMAIAIATTACILSGQVAAQEEKHSFVDIMPGGPAIASKLASLNFDVAGVSYESGAVGVVATDADLGRLARLGYSYTVRETSHPLRQGQEALADYTDPQEIATFLDQTVAAYPGIAKKLLVKNPLYEGQTLWAIKITKDPDLANDRPNFILDSQHHAREVMTAEIAKDAISYLTTRYATDSQVRNWVDSINIYIVPCVNPDGSMYVFTNDNMWRKNRHPACAVDLNRNYGFNWNACAGSSGACSDDTYRGASAESEPETQGMVQLFSDVRPLFGLTYHSYGQYLMYPYGCVDPDEKALLENLGQALNAILVKDNGAPGGWSEGPIWSTIYPADGGSLDTEYGRYGSYTYVIEVNSSSFQPDYATWRDITVTRQRTAWQFFLDKTLLAPQIRGKITDAVTGQPLAATVSLQEVAFTHGESPRTADSRGIYHWLVAANATYHATYSMPGYCSETRTVSVGTGPAIVDLALSYPAAPASLAAAANGDNRIDLCWTEVSGASEYHIYRGLSPGGPYSLVKTVAAPAVSASDTPISGQVTFYYVIRSFAGCESPPSEEASARSTGLCTMAPVFAGVSGVAATPSATCSLTVSWAAATGYCGGPVTYRIYRDVVPSFTPAHSNLVAAGLTATQYTDHAALANGSTYYYIVRACDGGSGAEDANSLTLGAVPLGPLSPGTWTDDAGDTGTARMSLEGPWSVKSTGGKSGPKVYATGTTTNNLCAALVTPPITLGTSPSLSFASKYDLETNYDAGIVEVATGPDYANWTKLATVNYPNRLAYAGNACGFPTSSAGTVFSKTIATPAYSASSYSGSLSAYAGQTVKLRWRVSSDSGVNGAGWWVDDVQVSGAMLPGSCVSGLSPNPKEVSPSGSPMTCSRGDGTSIHAFFTPACGALETAFYRGTGPITGGLAWETAYCAAGTSGQAAFDPGDPAPGSFYYFVAVGQNSTREGSYGYSFDGTNTAERTEAVGVGACDLGQDLSGACP